MHEHELVRGKGMFILPVSAHRGAGKSEIPPAAHNRTYAEPVQCWCQTRRTENIRWLEEDVLEIHEATLKPGVSVGRLGGYSKSNG